ncbi:ABC transporter substrate-binding protein [Gluconobacter sp. DsW_058]|uniref:ABC transporter substrate-binding protein n=1 Tax=Gluconobacter sp. DsW_058 TaxID=1511210 RepID=UPI000B738B4F|nr:ABC transporter substrate-binding protein [Gluconobacter sp. DsW_058]OUJ08010.1 pyridoxine biosynthesis protein [Gluconobacter sp. DsW_058]
MTPYRLDRRSMLRGIMAAGAVSSLPSGRAKAASRPLSLLTNWYAQAEHGGYYQASEDGLYSAQNLDVSIQMGGPQMNMTQLLMAGQCDIAIMQGEEAIRCAVQGIPAVAIATTFQKGVGGVMTHPDIHDIAELKGHPILISSEGRASFWVWLKKRYGFTEDQAHPYTYNLQPFAFNPQMAMQAFVSSEPYGAKKAGIPFNFLLLDDLGYAAYGNVLMVSRKTLEERGPELQKFIAASSEGWKRYIFGESTKGDAAIRKANPDMSADQLAWSRQKLRDIKALGAPGAPIMTINNERWQRIYDIQLSAQLIADSPKWKDGYTLDVVHNSLATVPA